MKKYLLTILFLAVAQCLCFAQETFLVKGKVTDTAGEPLIGASVVLRPLNLGAATDVNGNYSFEVASNLARRQSGELVASYINYKKSVFKVTIDGNNITHNFVLEEDVFQNEEIVVTGIASRTSKEVSDVSVARISAKELTEVNNYSSFNQLLTGKISGVQMSTSSGNVGSGYRFYVRGGGGLNGNEQPVIYIDGIRANNSKIEGYGVGGQDISLLANLNPNDVESIEILKGPAAASTYGTNGSNGVVLIKTKQGSLVSGGTKPVTVNYTYTNGFNEPSLKFRQEDVVTADDANAIFERGAIKEHSLNVAGGLPNLRYYASFQNRSENGIIPSNKMDKNSIRLNLSALPTENLMLNLSTSYTDNKILRPINDNSILGFLGNVLLLPTPYRFTKKDAILASSDIHRINQFIGSLNGTYTFFKGLEGNFAIGIDQMNWNQEQQSPYGYSYGGDREGDRALWMFNQRLMTFDFNLKYSFTVLPDLNITSIIGTQANENYNRWTRMEVKRFGTGSIIDIAGGTDVTDKGEYLRNTKQAGIFTEHQVNYLNTYMLSFALRKDYTSSLNMDNVSILYPKISSAIRVDKIVSLPAFINSFKIRAAYGENGQLPGSLDAIPLTWTSNATGYGAASRINSIGNPNLEPERIKEIELGFDTELFNEVNFEFTYYNQNADKSIIARPLAPSDGFGAFTQPYNIGSVKNWGFETLLQYNPIRSVYYDLKFGLIWNYQNNEVTSLGGEAPIYDDWSMNVIKEGLRKHEFYYLKTIGAQFDPTTHEYIGPELSRDPVSYGNPYPDHSGSLTINFKFLKNFNLYAMGEWGLNNKIFSNTAYFMAQFGGYKPLNDLQATLATQTPGTPEYINTANQIAKMDPVNQANFVFDAEYFVLRELSFSYDFTDLLKDFAFNDYIKQLTLGVSARNVWRTSAYKLSDFEVNSGGSGGNAGSTTSAQTLTRGSDFLTLQNPRTVNFWINVGF